MSISHCGHSLDLQIFLQIKRFASFAGLRQKLNHDLQCMISSNLITMYYKMIDYLSSALVMTTHSYEQIMDVELVFFFKHE